jgi:hypothetical protein
MTRITRNRKPQITAADHAEDADNEVADYADYAEHEATDHGRGSGGRYG